MNVGDLIDKLHSFDPKAEVSVMTWQGSARLADYVETKEKQVLLHIEDKETRH